MNINTKTLLASTLLTVLFATTSASAGQRDHFADANDYSVATESVQIKKVNFQAPSATVNTDEVLGGQR